MSHTNALSAILDVPIVSSVRKNHALEHATLNLISARNPRLRLVGRSSFSGFTVYGDIPTEELLTAAQDAARRLRAGQEQLAIHEHCGSNLVVAGVLAALGTFLVLGGKSKNRFQRLSRLPLAFVASTLGVILAQPLGPKLQARVTTESDLEDLRITGISREKKGNVTVHHVHTATG